MSFEEFTSVIELARTCNSDVVTSLDSFYTTRHPDLLEIVHALYKFDLNREFTEFMLIQLIGRVTAASRRKITKLRERTGSFACVIEEIRKSTNVDSGKEPPPGLSLREVYSNLSLMNHSNDPSRKTEILEEMFMKASPIESKYLMSCLENGSFRK